MVVFLLGWIQLCKGDTNSWKFLFKPENVRIPDKLSISPFEHLKENSEIGDVNNEIKIPIRVQ
jgi:hypothetical protein